MAIAEVTVIPIGTGTTSLSSYVADMQKVLEHQRGITYQLTSMSTIIEGPLNEVFTAIAALHEAPFLSGAQRVSTSVRSMTVVISRMPQAYRSYNRLRTN